MFEMKELNIAPYLRGTFSNAWTHQEAFVQEIGSTTVGQTVNYAYGGELGVLLHIASPVNLRIGAELFSTPKVTDAKGVDSTGVELFTLNSTIFVFNPNAALEFILIKGKSSRMLFTGGVGYANVSVKNEFAVTSAGQTALGLGSFTETGSANVMNYFTSFGYEFMFVDHVMMMLEAGYRYFPVKELENSQDQKTFAKPSTTQASGTPLLNSDGSTRGIDLSGAFVGLSFRFYLN